MIINRICFVLLGGMLANMSLATCKLNYNSNGNLLIDVECNQYQYNARNQLIEVQQANQSLNCRYHYNPSGLRDVKTCQSSDNKKLQLTYIYLDNQIINTKDNLDKAQTAYLQRDARYIVSANTQVTHYLSNMVHATSSLLLNQQSILDQIYNFSSYGGDRKFSLSKRISINFSQPLEQNPFLYDGEYRDFETGFIYLRARFYDPLLMRFIQRDSYNLLNRYSAFDNNPISNTDPSGHFSLTSLSLYGTIASIGLGLIAPLAILPDVFPYIYGLSGALNVFSTGLNMISDHSTSHLIGNGMAMAGMTLSTVGMMSTPLVNFGLNLADNTLEGAAMPMMSSDQGGVSAKKMALGALAALPTALFLASSSAYLWRNMGEIGSNASKSWGQSLLYPDAGFEETSARSVSVFSYAKPMLLGGLRTASAEWVRKSTFFPMSAALGEQYQYTKTSLATNMLLGAASGAYMYSSMSFVNRNIGSSDKQFLGKPLNKFLYNFTSSGWSVQFGLPTLESI